MSLTESPLDVAEALSERAAEKLAGAVAWVRKRKCAHCVSVMGFSEHKGRPFVYLTSLKELRRLFPGVKANVKRDGGSDEWSVTAEGIDFEVRNYLGCAGGFTREETL